MNFEIRGHSFPSCSFVSHWVCIIAPTPPLHAILCWFANLHATCPLTAPPLDFMPRTPHALAPAHPNALPQPVPPYNIPELHSHLANHKRPYTCHHSYFVFDRIIMHSSVYSVQTQTSHSFFRPRIQRWRALAGPCFSYCLPC